MQRIMTKDLDENILSGDGLWAMFFFFFKFSLRNTC